MTAIRVIFDENAFIPQQPVSLPAQSEAMVIVEQGDAAAQQALDTAVQEYYRNGEDAEDAAWSKAVAQQSHLAWEESLP